MKQVNSLTNLNIRSWIEVRFSNETDLNKFLQMQKLL